MNNTVKTFRASKIAAAATLAFVSASVCASTPTTGGVYRWVAPVQADGTADTNWFNPANWSGGQVPGPTDNVELDSNDHAVIDGARYRGGVRVAVGDVDVRDGAKLEVINGAILQTRDQVLYDRGRIIFRASGDAGESLIVAGDADPDACTDCVLVQNPSSQVKRTWIIFNSATVDMGLGGTTAASLTQTGTGELQLAAGPGHYSTLTADTLSLDGDLKISTYYGFEPQPGDSFQIMTANRTRTGQFIGLPEGGYVACTDYNVCLRISYRGGDGNDVVLTAETVSPAIGLLLPAVQKIRDAASTTRRSALATTLHRRGS